MHFGIINVHYMYFFGPCKILINRNISIFLFEIKGTNMTDVYARNCGATVTNSPPLGGSLHYAYCRIMLNANS